MLFISLNFAVKALQFEYYLRSSFPEVYVRSCLKGHLVGLVCSNGGTDLLFLNHVSDDTPPAICYLIKIKCDVILDISYLASYFIIIIRSNEMKLHCH